LIVMSAAEVYGVWNYWLRLCSCFG